MKHACIPILCMLASLSACASHGLPAAEAQQLELLIFSHTAGYRHDSIAAGTACLSELAGELGMRATSSEDPADFTDEKLARFELVVFLSTTGDVLDAAGQAAFERFIQGGGGFLGVHAATDTEYDWPWYTGLVGAQFENHPRIQAATLVRSDVRSPTTDFLPASWERTDEWYNFKAISPAINVLLVLDETSYEGGTNGTTHPAAWYHQYDGGRAFYTAGGHTIESYAEPLFREHLKQALRYGARLDLPNK